MRVLVVSNSFYPDHKGGGFYSRMLLFVKALQAVPQLDMLFFVSPETDTSPAEIEKLQSRLRRSWHPHLNLFLSPQSTESLNLPRWKQQARSIFNFFHHPQIAFTSGVEQVQAFEECLNFQPDAIFVHRLSAMPPAMLTQKTLPPIYLDLDDVEHKKFFREVSQPPYSLLTNLYYLQVPVIWWGELQAIRLARSTFVCSELDRSYLSQSQGLPGVVTIPNSITIPEPQVLTSEPTLLFLGTYSYQPNVNAANYLIEQIWPQIYNVMPSARLIIAGGSAERIRSYDCRVPGVEFTDFVDDLAALYQRVRVVCCPILSGGGTRVKIIEAAAYGKPIVATKIGAEGLELNDGQEFLQRDSVNSFAKACLRLLNNYSLCEKIGSAARTKAIQSYDSSNIIKSIQGIFLN